MNLAKRMMFGRVGVLLVLVVLAGCGPGDKPKGFGRGADRDFDMFLGADAAGSGRLAVDYDFGQEVAAPLSLSANGTNLFVAVDPGFNPILTDEPSFFVIAEGTEITIEVTAADPGVSMKLNGEILDAPGASVVLGLFPDVHIHPEWQVALPEDADLAPRTITFKVTSSSATYGESDEYTLILAPTFAAVEE